MKILQIHKHYYPRDGASTYMLLLSRLLTEAGHEVIPFAMQDPRNLPTPFADFFVSSMDVSEPGRLSVVQKMTAAARVLYNREAVRKIRALLDAHRPDIVHVHNEYNHLSPAILLEIHKRGIPIVMTLHDYHLLSPNYTLFHHGRIHEEDATGWHLSCVGNYCVKNAFFPSLLGVTATNLHHSWYTRTVSQFIAPSQFLRDIHIHYGWDKKKFSYIPHPVEMSRDIQLQADNGTVVYAGRLSVEKGVDMLLRAAGETPEISYVIAGTGPEEDSLHVLATELGLKNVRFAGFLSGDVLKDTIRKARLTVLPARWYEVAPLSLLESLSLGTIAIGSALGGIPEILPREFLVAPNDPHALADKIREWHRADKITRDGWRTQLALRVGKEHDPAHHLEHVLSLYHQVIYAHHPIV